MRADARMLHDPLRTRGRAVAAGVALLVLVLAGTVILGLVRPRASAGADAELLLVGDTGALHVQVGERLHPVANLASARLVLGTAASLTSHPYSRPHHAGLQASPLAYIRLLFSQVVLSLLHYKPHQCLPSQCHRENAP